MKKSLILLLLLLFTLSIISCKKKEDENVTPDEKEEEEESTTPIEDTRPYIDGKKLVVFGDSITALGTWGKTVAEELNMYFYNAAIGGITTSQGLNRFESNVRNSQADFVTILFGHNDLIMESKNNPRVSLKNFKANLIQIVNNVREIGAIPILLTTNPLNPDIFWTAQGQRKEDYEVNR